MKRRSRSRQPPARPAYSAPALEKGMDILELLATAENGLTITEIARRLGRRMSELFRVIMVMEARNWLWKDPSTARYVPSYHLLKVAYRGTPARTLSSVASPVMYELSTRINQSCHLVVLSGSQGMVILRQENQRRHANLSVRVGAVIDLLTSCSGHVLLAHMDDERRRTVLEAIPRPWKVPRRKLLPLLERVRQRGFEMIPSPITPGVTDIGAPIMGFGGSVVASLTVPYLHARDDSLPVSVDKTCRLLMECGARISRDLGWDP